METDGWSVPTSRRRPLDADAGAEHLLGTMLAAAREVNAPAGTTWGVAVPDPFDYEAGVALFDASVGKFAALHGVDVGAALRSGLEAGVAFVNDADAFALGEWRAGAGQRVPRLAAITLGTGVGSGWLSDGRVADPGFPRGGRIHHATVGGRPLEDVMSRRAIRRAFARAGGDPGADVREISEAAGSGDPLAASVLREALTGLGSVVARATAGFGADLLVVGGSMAASWELFAPWFDDGARVAGAELPPIRVSADAERSGVVGAALCAQRVATEQ